MSNYYWEIILENSSKKITLPYLLGAKLIFFKNSQIDEIEELFHQIINSENDSVYSMYHCPNIREYVIFKNKYGYSFKGTEIRNPKTNILKLVFGLNMEFLGKNLDQIQKNLTKRYEEDINAGKFSFLKGKFHEYNNDEKNEILHLSNQLK
ncbi:hypothetical protein GON26_12520 [Flavobacterium sp. GA093]|uniref:Uncharacterized protein n=1 Tax=Flavobacterium hydrocarbonoxydans TaxID=2683249 RepID=A0A6I4NVS8_9FLAO|nr:hypothetical protein [Flavobacterium hydrocarbonoxydans]MWB95187.1 hypothetical protein [Flavobacterium hydrocarbonoxydans]